MKCEVCGRELAPEETVCECGNVLKSEQSGEKKEKSAKPKKASKAVNAAIFLAMAVVMGVAAFFVYRLIITSDIRDKDNWHTVENENYSITIPKAMEESDDDVEIDSDFTKLGFFKCSKASVYISKAELNDEEQKQIKSEGLEVVINETVKKGKNQTINGYEINPQKVGDLIIVEYPLVAEGYIKGEEELWAVSATLITEQSIYQIDAYCANDDAEDYQGAMVKWLESFKEK